MIRTTSSTAKSLSTTRFSSFIFSSSSSVNGTGLDSGPTNPVTPRIERIACQHSSDIIIFKNTYPGNTLRFTTFFPPLSKSSSSGTRMSTILSCIPRFSIILAILVSTFFSYPEYVWITYHFAVSVIFYEKFERTFLPPFLA